MVTTSSVLKPDQFPHFQSDVAATFKPPAVVRPADGTHYAVATSDDGGYQRCAGRSTSPARRPPTCHSRSPTTPSRRSTTSSSRPTTRASTTGRRCPNVNGHTRRRTSARPCDINWDTLHPFLAHYQTNTNKDQAAGAEDCTPTGTTGGLERRHRNSGGYQD